jgi:SAM-dependent methyltransferase
LDQTRARHGQPSLDEIVHENAAIVADQIQKAAEWAKSEMDLQIEVAGALKGFAREAKITLEGHHNVTIATGRPDSVYGSVIVEYKDPGTLSPKKDARPNRDVVDQLKKRFYDVNREEHRNWNSMFGVGTDGKYLIFLRFRDDKWTDQEPLEVDRHSTERFLWALYNLGQKGKPYQPEYLHGDFGSESPIAHEGVRTLYEEILKTENPKAQVFFNQWKILFGEVCGYDVENPSDKLKKLAEFYSVNGKPQPAQLLFAVHTYYAVLIKLLAAEIVSFFNPWMPRQVEKLQNATTSAKLKRELEELERGGIFHEMGITNFLEGDLFSWYLAVWSGPVEAVVRKMVSKLDDYNPGTFSEEPAQSRDLLKKLYQQLFPKSVRHDLGEYYTPDWLAEHVLNELGYEGDPDKRLLDPACGSGTFLVMAINRIRRWYDLNREKCAYDEGELLRKILANVIGFDLNPLAVMAARTNYLVAIKDLIRHIDHVEIPVYLCDSILTPAEYGDLFTGGAGNVAKVPCSAMKPPHLLVPKEIARSPEEVAGYAEILEDCIKNGYSSGEFLSRCREESLDVRANDAHAELYDELVRLDKANKNGIWARIIKNNFAPLFVGRVDYVAGNPPWVRWAYLPEDYREATKEIWHHYGLFSLTGHQTRLGPGEKDLSQLFVYACMDAYVEDGGKLGFVITQSVFRSKGQAAGFRRFRLGQGTHFSILRVHDFALVKPFEAANLTCTFVALKGKETKYPVCYVEFRRRPGEHITSDDDLQSVLARLEGTACEASPLTEDPTSHWRIMDPGSKAAEKKVEGPSDYKAYQGARTDPYGVYWIEIMERRPNGEALVRNIYDAGKTSVRPVTAVIELGNVYPAIKGRNVRKWRIVDPFHILMVQDANKRAGIPEQVLRTTSPKTFAFLNKFKTELLAVSSKVVAGLRRTGPFYSMYGVGTYTLAPWKVVWPMMGNTFRASVVSTLEVDQGASKPVIPCTNTITFVPARTADEAHYICALMNSSPCRLAITSGSAAGRGFGTPAILSTLRIPAFSETSKLHAELAHLSEECHAGALRNDDQRIAALEAQIDRAAAKLWGITEAELKSIRAPHAGDKSKRESAPPLGGDEDARKGAV